MHNHDGFYLRVGLGLGHAGGTVTSGSGGPSTSISANGLPIEFMLGGTVSPGLVIGGGFSGGAYLNPTIGGTSTEKSQLNLSTFGPFLDWYFDPKAGLHAQVLVGFARMAVKYDGNSSSEGDSTGAGVSLGFGNDWWVADQVSFGVMGRLDYYSVKAPVSVGDITYKFFAPGVVGTFTYH